MNNALKKEYYNERYNNFKHQIFDSVIMIFILLLWLIPLTIVLSIALPLVQNLEELIIVTAGYLMCEAICIYIVIIKIIELFRIIKRTNYYKNHLRLYI